METRPAARRAWTWCSGRSRRRCWPRCAWRATAVLKPEARAGSTRLRPREPLWPARLEQAARDLALALAQRGYLEAARDRAHRAPRPDGRGRRLHHRRRARGSAWASARVEGPPGVVAALEPRHPAARRASPSAASRPRPPPQHLRDGPRSPRAIGGPRSRVAEAYDPGRRPHEPVFRVEPGSAPGRRGARASAQTRVRPHRGPAEGGRRCKSDALEEASDLLEEDAAAQGHRLPT